MVLALALLPRVPAHNSAQCESTHLKFGWGKMSEVKENAESSSPEAKRPKFENVQAKLVDRKWLPGSKGEQQESSFKIMQFNTLADGRYT